MASVIANRESTLIEPAYILSSVFSFHTQSNPMRFEDPETQKELDEVTSVLESHGLRPMELAQRLRSPSETAEPPTAATTAAAAAPSRSESCKRAFNDAAAAAEEESAPLIRLRHLIGGIFSCCKELCPALNINPDVAARLAVALSRPAAAPPPPPVPKPSPAPVQEATEDVVDIVLHSLDAKAVLEPEINWAIVGPKFATLCELAWEAGSAGNLGQLLQSLTEKILSFIPRASHGAILILDPATGELELKAHAPRGDASLSKSSAQQALDDKKAFIWQRMRDMSKTQIASSLESGVYAPIIADDRSFGVICLNSKSIASRLTAEDLFLAASLGHQIGLVLANRDLKAEIAQKINILERLMTNFSPQVRTHLIKRAQAGRLKLGGERSNVSILCADIRGFTAMAAKMDTDDLLTLLNDYFAAMVECVFRHEGTIDKFIGDALLVVFGSPEAHPRHAEQAARASLALQQATQAVSERRRARGEITCGIGIGVHTGDVIHGFIGSPDRMEFTIIGDAVNMTARYCSAAGHGEIIVSPPIYDKLWRELEVEAVEVTTKHEGNLNAYKLLGFHTT